MEQRAKLVDALAIAVAIVDGEHFTYANDALIALLGRRPDGHWLDAFAHVDRATLQGAHVAALAGQRRQHQVTLLHRDAAIPVEVSLNATDGGVAIAFVDLRMREMLEERLIEAQDRLERLIESTPQAVIAVDARGRIVLWNRAAEQTFGYTAPEIDGEMFARLFARKHEAALAAEQFASGEIALLGRTTELVGVTKDGSEFRLEIAMAASAHAGTTWFTAILHDIGERLRRDQALRSSEERYHLLFDSIPLPAWMVDGETMRFLAVNDAMVRAYGYTRDELLAMRLPDIKIAEEIDAAIADIRHGPTGGVSRIGVRKHRRKDGSLIDVDITVHRVFLDGHRGSIGIGRDVTEAHKLEEQLRQAQKMEAIGLLAGGIAHDFNNVLAVVLTNAALAIEELGARHPVTELVDEMQTAAQRAATLTRQLLAFSRKERRQAKPLALNSVVTSVEAMLSRLVGENIAMTAVLAPQLGTIEADVSQLEQVLVNLVVNARDAMPDGGKLVIETTNCDVDRYLADELGVPPGRYVALSVSDTGCGMEDTVHRRVFEPFFTTKALGKGTGLGLSMVFGIVKQNNGGITVASELGRGTTFRVYLPSVAPKPTHAHEAKPVFVPERGTETILLVEDDVQVRSVLRRYLKSWGYALVEACNGEDAVAALDREQRIDVVLTDVVMPGLDGIALARQLREREPGIGVIYMSGYTEHPAMPPERIGAEELFLEKPFTPELLSKTLRRACRRG